MVDVVDVDVDSNCCGSPLDVSFAKSSENVDQLRQALSVKDVLALAAF